MSSTAATVELVEREAYLELLDANLAEVAAGEGRVALVSGEAGVGKTALVRAFCARLDPRTRVLWGACDGLRTPRPLGPLVDIAAQTDGPLAGALERGEQPAGCFAALADEVDDARPAVIVIEDVQWADEATLDVLLMLGRRAERVRALTIVTFRDDELGPRHPLRRAVGDLRRGPGVRRLSLPRLSAEAVDRLAEPYGVSGSALYATTGGNSFFVTEVLEAGTEIIPDTARDAVLARAAHASADARRVLDAVAVVPQRAEVTLLEGLLGDDIAHLDECLVSGMLLADGPAVAFRHELARQAIEKAISPRRRVALHRDVLVALQSGTGSPDPARLAHHAEASDDGPAALEFSREAGERAALLGAHREASGQFARAVHYGTDLDLPARAALLDRYARECSLIAAPDEEISALEAALECHRRLGDDLATGDTLRRLSGALSCKGGSEARAERLVDEAVEVLERGGPSIELAHAYAFVASCRMDSEDMPGAVSWAQRAMELGEHLGDEKTRITSLNDLGTIEALNGIPGGREKLELSRDLARRANLEGPAGRAYLHLAWTATRRRRYALAADAIREGLEYCAEHDLELYAFYLHAYRSRAELDRGEFDAAAESASTVTRDSRSSRDAVVPALVVRGLARARRGDPDHVTPIAEALALTPGGELQRLGPVAAARAEVMWIEGRRAELDEATVEALALARDRGAAWVVGELAVWRRRAGLVDDIGPDEADGPYALSLAGDAAGAAAAWRELDCPYEAALALAGAEDVEGQRQALDELQAMGAGPPAAVVAGALRERGVRGLPRGPRPRTRENAGGLTAREAEVLALLAEGMRNAQIAERLVLSTKTVGHHVSAILRKLDARSRGEAAAAAARLGMLDRT